jgi:putative ABC transport system ATP-binding protein
MGPGGDHLIELAQVVKVYESAAGKFTAIKGVDLIVNNGEFASIVGKSGSGKSTLINMITGIDRPTSGEVWVAGTPVHKLDENRMAAWRGRNIGVVFQFFQLLPTLTAVENVMLPMDFCGVHPKRKRRAHAVELLESVGLADQADKLPSALSGGEQQRVAIARALANDPQIVIGDEPTGNLDSKTAAAIFELFTRLVGEGKTIIMVTHDRDLANLTPRRIQLADGEIVRGGRPEQVQGESAEKRTTALMLKQEALYV